MLAGMLAYGGCAQCRVGMCLLCTRARRASARHTRVSCGQRSHSLNSRCKPSTAQLCVCLCNVLGWAYVCACMWLADTVQRMAVRLLLFPIL